MNHPVSAHLSPRRAYILFILFLLFAVAATVGAGPPDNKAAPGPLTVEVVSSAPDQITGGDARLHITLPRGLSFAHVSVLVNGIEMSERFTAVPGTSIYSGLIDGLAVGENDLDVRFRRGNSGPPPVEMTLVNYPITGPVFSGPHQEPFVCTVQKHGLGQPLVDNYNSGFRVYEDGEVIGYSKDCSAETLVTYVYKSTDGDFKQYTPGDERPADMEQTTTMDGLTVDYIVRWERGTINRFIYSIAMLAPDDGGPENSSRTAWNGKLIYYFQGGVAIGHDQGDPSNGRMLYDYGLSQGYAIVYSTGTKTGTHYNLELGGETALMVKERFVELYDLPIYTVGVGGSGGGIQQYVYGQNHKGLLDAAIPQYSYPDMVTQAIHIGDCELLEFYMDLDVMTSDDSPWEIWDQRTLLEGLNASNTVINTFTGMPGSSECVEGWRGLSPLALNPNYGYVEGQEEIEPASDVAAIKWTHFEDLVNVFGTDADGYARNYWDNVGVQYGLESVASGAISPEEFLRVNGFVGGWKNEPEMVQEGSPFFPPNVIDLTDWDPWSSRNQVYSVDPTTPAPRTSGNLTAMNAAYESGLVFIGDIDIPIIDWRHYLEDELNMHNSHQSFASRQRIRDFGGHSDNQVIWFTDVADGTPEFDQTPEAFQVMDEWMENILEHPRRGVAANKPPRAVDRCFDANGNEIAAGDDVWDGILDDDPAGACTQAFQLYGTSRTVAGGPIRGGVFKCQLQPVTQAIADGDYGVWTPTAMEQAMLEAIFPAGVCDYDLPDAGLPAGW